MLFNKVLELSSMGLYPINNWNFKDFLIIITLAKL